MFVRLFQEYQEQHRLRITQIAHKFSIIAIAFPSYALLERVHLFSFYDINITFARLFYLFQMGVCIRLNAKLGIILAVSYLPFFALANIFPWYILVAILILGWIAQLAAHRLWEKNKPAFMSNLVQFLSGPLFFIAYSAKPSA